jgi:hypothetical protein
MGEIMAEYTVANNIKSYVITLPKGMVGEFVFSQSPKSVLFKNSKKMSSKKAILKLKEGVTIIEEKQNLQQKNNTK